MVVGRGEVVRVYLTAGNRGMIQVCLRTRCGRAFGRGRWPAWGSPVAEPGEVS